MHKKTWDYLTRSCLILLLLILSDLMPKTYSEPWYKSKMELLVKLVNAFQPFPISAKSSILDVWYGSEYACVLSAGLIDFQLPKKKKNFTWYFVKPSLSRLLRRKKNFDVKSAKKEIHFQQSYLPPRYRQLKTKLIRYQVSHLFTSNVHFT